jgi:hypothetical protein
MEQNSGIPVNMPNFKEIANEELDLAESLIKTFLSTYPEQMEQISRFSKSGESQPLYKATHLLNNSLKVLSAGNAVEVSIEIERKSKIADLTDIGPIVRKLETQMEILNAYFRNQDWKKDFERA